MKILIVASAFAPDSITAAVRLSNFARYLTVFGHNVTIIRSGKVSGVAEKQTLKGLESVKIYSYEGDDAFADQFERGSMREAKSEQRKISKPTNFIILVIRGLYRRLTFAPSYYYEGLFRIYRKIMKLYKENDDLRGFDVVLSTYSPLGCHKAGRSISKRENCKWVADFRDLPDKDVTKTVTIFVNRILQKTYVNAADASLFVSKENADYMRKRCPTKTKVIHTIHNGFHPSPSARSKNSNGRIPTRSKTIRICYTGVVREAIQDMRPLFRVIGELSQEGKIHTDHVSIEYAGYGFDILRNQAKEYGLEHMIIDHGYISRIDAAKIQVDADLFCVLAWNSKKDQGILTGKVYEALSHRKPIVALVAGDLPNSELKEMVQKYNLGICYEEADHPAAYQALKDYIYQCYQQKQLGKDIVYHPNEEVFQVFCYENIVRQLESILLKCCDQKH